jgi:hypothetical protein
MRKTSTMSLLIVVVLLSGGIWRFATPTANAQSAASGAGEGLQQFAGQYWLVFDLGGIPIPAIFQIGSDGAGTTFTGVDYGIPGLQEPHSGTLTQAWRSGPRQLTGRNVVLAYDPVTGFPVHADVNTFVSDYDGSFEFGEGVLYPREYDLTAGENPLDPSQGTAGEPLPYQFWRFEQP